MRSVFSGLFSWLQDGAQIVTPTPLLARVIAHEFAQRQLTSGQRHWQRPVIQSLDAWLASLWQQARYADLSTPVLLSPQQETFLWRSVIEPQASELFDVRAAAALSRQAERTMAEWHISDAHPLWKEHSDGRQFLAWRERFGAICSENGWMTRADLLAHSVKWLQRRLAPQTAVAYAGWDQLTPALRELRGALNAPIVVGSLPEGRPHRAVIEQKIDTDAEIEAAARWARACFSSQPDATIGIFLPDLALHRTRVERAFQSVFYSGQPWEPGFAPEPSVFHISGAPSLTEEAVVASALLILELARAPLAQAQATALLLCPYLKGSREEKSQRASADLRLRRTRLAEIGLPELQRVSESCPKLQRSLRNVSRITQQQSFPQDFTAWSGFFGSILHAVGWPGDFDLSTHEQNVVEIWKNALTNLAGLNLVSSPVTVDEAIEELTSMLRSSNSEERGDLFSPVQIFDAEDASGLQFDRAFVAGMSSASWPPRPETSPLIPLLVQRLAGVPGTSAESVHELQQHATAILFGSAGHISATFRERMSPVAAPFVSIGCMQELWTGNTPAQLLTPAALDAICDSNAPAVDRSHEIRGGTAIIKLQSACAFHAFAEMRLNAKDPDCPAFGVDPLEHGDCTHKTLELIWREIQTQQRLKSMPLLALEAVVDAAVKQAVPLTTDGGLRSETLLVERERVRRIALEWLLEFDKRRLVPFHVEALEQEVVSSFAGLQLKMRIDRIDRLHDGGTVVIDYKTGATITGEALACPRPREPQLLLYALAAAPDSEGLFFAKLHTGGVRMLGKTRRKHMPGQRIADWDVFTGNSRAEIQNLAEQYLSGYAAVNRTKNACEYCKCKPLCRVNAERAERSEESDD